MGSKSAVQISPDILAKSEMVIFDLFTTLLVSPFLSKKAFFDYLERKGHARGFSKARVDAECAVRFSGGIGIGLDDIYSVIPLKYSFMKDVEIEYI